MGSYIVCVPAIARVLDACIFEIDLSILRSWNHLHLIHPDVS